jgi:hypothetical protein
MEALQRRGTGYLLPPRHQARREKVRRIEEEEAEQDGRYHFLYSG